MPYGTFLMDIEAGKYMLVTPENKPDADDPRYGDEVHIVPLVALDGHLSLVGHECSLSCYCRPSVRKQVWNRTLVIHNETVN
jgi:hypothetical protein